MYKPDCLLVNKGSSYGGWQFIDGISTKSSETWRPVLQNHTYMGDNARYMFAHIGTEYATFWEGTNVMHVMDW